jgi:bacterioferritin (cytochrome b1)
MDRIPEMYAVVGKDSLGGARPEISEVERLINEFEAHETQEGKFLRHYQKLAGETDNRMVKFLLQMIVSDEEKHHAITHAMAATLKGDLNWTNPQNALRGLYDLGEEKGNLLEVTKDFIRVEKEGINEYRQLIKESKGYYSDLFGLLFRSMIHDSEKHIEILEFLHKKLQEA